MIRRWFRRLLGASEDPDERRRIDAELDRNRTDAIVAADRSKYGRRSAGSSIEDDPGRDRPER